MLIPAVPTTPITPTTPVSGEQSINPWLDRTVDRVLSIQRPIVMAHLRRVASRNKTSNPAALTRALEARYIAAVTAGWTIAGLRFAARRTAWWISPSSAVLST